MCKKKKYLFRHHNLAVKVSGNKNVDHIIDGLIIIEFN